MALHYLAAAPRGRAPRGGKVSEDREPARLFTRLHMPAAGPSMSRFRVMAELVGGRRALVCFGPNRAEALDRARQLRQAGALPADTADLVLQCWTGGLAGDWHDVPGRHLRRGRQPRRNRRKHAWFDLL